MAVDVDLDSARRDWASGYRALLGVADRTQGDLLHAQVEAVIAELRKRVGSTFTLGELAAAYAGSERWTREAIAEHAASPGWPRTAAVASDAAFHLYARSAQDYGP
jgi:hypothetical protein